MEFATLALATLLALQSSTASAQATPAAKRSDLVSSPERICDGFDEQWGRCPGIEECNLCIPRDCLFSDWGDWYDGGGCVGLRFRRRDIDVVNNECGQPCVGVRIESQEHMLAKCTPNETDCVFSAWSDWSSCEKPQAQAMRQRSIERHCTKNGRPCTGPTQETKACSAGPTPIPCQLAPWHEWTSCSATCGTGRHTRMRRIAVEAAHGGESCNAAVLEAKPCMVTPCENSDCQISEWTMWSICDQAHPQRYRSRAIRKPAINDGTPCPSELTQTEGCRTHPQDCDLSDWTDWSSCDKSCEGGQKFRERTLNNPNDLGGACERHALRETSQCSTGPCYTETPDSCKFSPWTAWSACSTHCGVGSKSRKRGVQSLASPGGSGCTAPVEEVAACQESGCDMTDCKWGDWDTWSDCSSSCGGGTKRRSREVAVSPLNGGALCAPLPASEVVPCKTESCQKGCINGAWGPWMDWTDCSATCSSGFRSRHRDVDIQPNSCGMPAAGLQEQFQVCTNLPACVEDRDCALSEWGEWSHCSCHCFGIRERSRYIIVFASGQGRPCIDEGLRVIEPCNPAAGSLASPDCGGVPKQDCVMGDWEEWAQCTALCGGGQRERKRTIATPPANGGEPCNSPLTVTTACNTSPCQDKETCTDCQWGAWSEWGDCSDLGGQRLRERSVERMNNHCGKPCEVQSAKELGVCSSRNAKKTAYCSWTQWSESATCTGCGSSTSMRTRILGMSTTPTTPSNYLFQGKEDSNCAGTQLNVSLCPIVESCLPQCLPRHCSFGDWSDWNEPTCVGLCERHRVIAVTNNECGVPCDGKLLETKQCAAACQQPKDCIFSDWSVWTSCPGGAANAHSTRTRVIAQPPENNGQGCTGPLQETRDCTFRQPTDCKLENWGQWTPCSQSCGSGWHSRHRGIEQEAVDGGKRCLGSLEELRPCEETTDCDFVSRRNCILGPWSGWSVCDGDAQRYRDRSIQQPPAAGGTSCVGALMETESCHKKKKDCQVSEWTSWGECDKTCGGGQTARHRQIIAFPDYGGAPCPSKLMEVQGCKTQLCSVQDCQVGVWSEWGTCSKTCGVGQQMRGRQVLGLRGSDGHGCDTVLGETRECADNPPCDFADCEWGEWSDWSGCTCSCDGGQRSRNRHIAKAPRGGGKPCEPNDKEQVVPCNTQSCDSDLCQDGEFGHWSDWSPCSVTCSGGVTFRIRKVVKMADACGKPPVGKSREEDFCNVDVPCVPDLDCLLSDWSEWGDCSSSCDGVKQRARQVKRYGRGGGAWCQGALEETWPCNSGSDAPAQCGGTGEQPVDCQVGEWRDWSTCSAACGGGQHTRSRNILMHPVHGGRRCLEALSEIRECAREPCSGTIPVDCRLGEWEDWGACGKCSGERRRFRSILEFPENGGASCEPFDAEEAADCPRKCHERTYCTWGGWEEWSTCSATCGEGAKRKRRRYLHLDATPEGQLPNRVSEIMAKYEDLWDRTQTLESHHMQELMFAFVGGCASLGVVFLACYPFMFARGRGHRFDGGLSAVSDWTRTRSWRSAQPGHANSRREHDTQLLLVAEGPEQ